MKSLKSNIVLFVTGAILASWTATAEASFIACDVQYPAPAVLDETASNDFDSASSESDLPSEPEIREGPVEQPGSMAPTTTLSTSGFGSTAICTLPIQLELKLHGATYFPTAQAFVPESTRTGVWRPPTKPVQ